MVDVVTIGSVLQDIMLETNLGVVLNTPQDRLAQKKLAFELGAKIPVDHALVSVGGGAANAAATFASFGFRVAISSRVGHDESGVQVRSFLAARGIETGSIQIDREHQTGLSLVLIKNPEREHVAFPYRGANEAYVAPAPADLDTLNPQWLYMTALQGPHWQEEMMRVFECVDREFTPQMAKMAQLKMARPLLAWNPGAAKLAMPVETLNACIAKTTVLIVNKDEATEIVAREMTHERNISIRTLLSKLISLGSKWVIITDGTQGAYATNGRDTYHAHALRVTAVDTTGAGDAFGSALIAGLMITHDDMLTALKYAIVNSAAVVTEVGAQFGLLDREEAEKRLKRVVINLLS